MTQRAFNNALSEIRWYSNSNDSARKILIDIPKGILKEGFLLIKVLETITKPIYL